MSKKLDIRLIFSNHLSTLYDSNNQAPGTKPKYSKWDITVFYLIPFIAPILIVIFKVTFTQPAITASIVVASIFSGLLLNLLILILSLVDRTRTNSNNQHNGKHRQQRKQMLTETFYNVSYAAFIALVLASIATVGLLLYSSQNRSVMPETCASTSIYKIILAAGLAYLSLHLILTVIMIIKRVYILISTDQ